MKRIPSFSSCFCIAVLWELLKIRLDSYWTHTGEFLYCSIKENVNLTKEQRLKKEKITIKTRSFICKKIIWQKMQDSTNIEIKVKNTKLLDFGEWLHINRTYCISLYESKCSKQVVFKGGILRKFAWGQEKKVRIELLIFFRTTTSSAWQWHHLCQIKMKCGKTLICFSFIDKLLHMLTFTFPLMSTLSLLSLM